MLRTHKYCYCTKFSGLGGLSSGISAPLTFTLEGSDVKCHSLVTGKQPPLPV
jgi:hypothetical protein